MVHSAVLAVLAPLNMAVLIGTWGLKDTCVMYMTCAAFPRPIACVCPLHSVNLVGP